MWLYLFMGNYLFIYVGILVYKRVYVCMCVLIIKEMFQAICIWLPN